MQELQQDTQENPFPCAMCGRPGYAIAGRLGWLCWGCLNKFKRVAHRNGYLPDTEDMRKEEAASQGGAGCYVAAMVFAVALIVLLIIAPAILRF